MSQRKRRTSAIVIDASVLNKTLLDEAESDDVTAALARAANEGIPLLVLPLTSYEVGNVLVMATRRARLKLDAAKIDALVTHALALVEERTGAGSADLALRHDLTYYDASYLALALAEKGAKLWTFDIKLGKAAEVEGCRVTTDEILRS